MSETETDARGDWRSLCQAWRDVELAAARADETGSEKDRGALARAMEALRHVVQQKTDTTMLWEKLRQCTEILVKLRREERRLKESRYLSMRMDKVLYFAALQTAVAMKYITDPVERAKFAEEARLLPVVTLSRSTLSYWRPCPGDDAHLVSAPRAPERVLYACHSCKPFRTFGRAVELG